MPAQLSRIVGAKPSLMRLGRNFLTDSVEAESKSYIYAFRPRASTWDFVSKFVISLYENCKNSDGDHDCVLITCANMISAPASAKPNAMA